VLPGTKYRKNGVLIFAFVEWRLMGFLPASKEKVSRESGLWRISYPEGDEEGGG
jgi:hypothetical protein